MMLESFLPGSYHWIHTNGGQIGLGLGSQEAGAREQVKYPGSPKGGGRRVLGSISPSPEYG